MSKRLSSTDTHKKIDDLQSQLTALESAHVGLAMDGVDAVLTSSGPVLIGDARQAVAQSEARYRHLIKRLAALVVELTPRGEVIYVNEAVSQVTGLSSAELVGWDWLDLLLPCHEPISVEAMRQLFLESGELTDVRTSIRSCDGNQKIFSWNSVNVYDLERKIERIIYFGINVTSQVLAEQELGIAAIAFESQEGMIVTDSRGMILRVNRAFTTITGYSPEEAIGNNPRMLKSGYQREEFYAAMWAAIQKNGAWTGEIWNRRKNGECYPERLAITAVKNAHGIITHYVGTLTDITMSVTAAEKIKHLAFYDPLTDLPNRLLLRNRLKSAMTSSKRSGLKGALLFIDMDDFKTINDSLGHDMGDLLLQQVAQRLGLCVREDDTVARLGGDEFVVMMEDLSENSLEAVTKTEIVGNKILAALNQPYQLDTSQYYCTPSIGAILFGDKKQSMDELLKQADIAMYQAKALGRNTLSFFAPQMQSSIDKRVALVTDLRAALPKQQFRLFYQAQVNHNHQILGVEVLIRWQHPQRGNVSPADFIPLAEATGLILPIGQWVLESACALLNRWESHPHTQALVMSVNVSARQFHQSAFIDQVSQIIQRTAINPNRLMLEITESLVLDNIDDTVVKMNALRAIGVRFAMDDFGTGYSCLSSLKKLPIDQLKIDQSFVQDIDINPDGAVIVKTIIAMAGNLDMEVVAEGVETEAQRAFLEQHGCSLFQGYLFSKPVPIEQFEALLSPVAGGCLL